MAATYPNAAPERRVSAGTDHLCTAPLPELLAEYDALIVDSEIDRPGFHGAWLKLTSGPIVLSVPAARSAERRETTSRYLLGRALGVRLPSPFRAVAREAVPA